MSRKKKIILGIVVVILIYFVLDFSFIFFKGRPLFAIKGSTPYAYKGLLYDVYACPEYSVSQIKRKGLKFSCAVGQSELGTIQNILDTTKEIDNFVCASALEKIYENNDFIYYLNCIKSDFILVTYQNGYQESIKKALKNGSITINDLDRYQIRYIKEEK